MKVSTKGRYGLRALIDLAAHKEEEPISLMIIANRQGISMNYLEQVFSILKRAKLVKSIKGAQGGYKLACDIEKISVKQILELLEGDLSIVEYEESGEKEDILDRCIRECIWKPIDQKIDNMLQHIMLKDMVNDYLTLKQQNKS